MRSIQTIGNAEQNKSSPATPALPSFLARSHTFRRSPGSQEALTWIELVEDRLTR